MERLSAKAKREMKKLADYISANSKRKVKMYDFFGERIKAPDVATGMDCGTVCCAAGHYVAEHVEKYRKEAKGMDYYSPAVFAALGMGLTGSQADALFCPLGFMDDRPRDRYYVHPTLQKRRLLAVLRGKKPLKHEWLIGR